MSIKSILCLLFLFVKLSFSFAQTSDKIDINQFTFAELEIKDARINDIDYTDEYINGKAYLYFYKSVDGDQIHLSNYFELEDTQSFGRIYNFKRELVKETDSTYEKDIYEFKWSYKNTYDDEKGTADIILSLIYKPKGIYFELVMIQENLDVSKYKSEFKGDVSFFDYLLEKSK